MANGGSRAPTARRVRPGGTARGAARASAEPRFLAHSRASKPSRSKLTGDSHRLTPVSCRYLLPPTRLMTATPTRQSGLEPEARTYKSEREEARDTVPRPDRPTPDMRATPPLSITNESVSHWVDPRQQMLSGLRWHPVSHMRRPQLSYPASVLSRSSSSGPAIDMSRKISSVTSAAVTFS